ncbi:expressed unknown protein [Seminavis robusta]|uniref:VWFD domain-containing protein n=1 Tax=Seminavis robusta TaxID=568900 RepID=A0A9N8HL90_9STRA|nr:expressed unknown protein [Seminavis robusta]|eukprot:Sro666_g184010.1 n/a (452) ;mRNA; f:29339-30789
MKLFAILCFQLIVSASASLLRLLDKEDGNGNHRFLGGSSTCPGQDNPSSWCLYIGDYSKPIGGQTCYNDYDVDCYCDTGYIMRSVSYASGVRCCSDSSGSGGDDGTDHCRRYSAVATKRNYRTCFDNWDDCDCPSGYDYSSSRKTCCAQHGNFDTHCQLFYGPHAQAQNVYCPCHEDEQFCECKPGFHLDNNYCVPMPTATNEPKTFGDPHIVTWHNHEFEYHGECDLLMLHAPTIGMDVHVRTTIRYDYSFISQAAVRIGQDVFEVVSYGEYMLNSIDLVDLPAKMGGNYVITKPPMKDKRKIKYLITKENGGVNIEFMTFKDYVSVKIHNGTKAEFDDATGMMGHYETGDMVARDGYTSMDDPALYGQEWQVRPERDGQLFSLAREPQYPHQCRLPSPNAVQARARRLGEVAISKEAAEAACSAVSESMRPPCIKDVLKTQDLDIAEIY